DQVRRRTCRPQARRAGGPAGFGEVGPHRRGDRRAAGCPALEVEPKGRAFETADRSRHRGRGEARCGEDNECCRNSEARRQGEAVVLAKNGVSSFAELQLALSEGRHERMIFYAFDLLWLDGEDLRSEPLIDRKEKLRDLLSPLGEEGPLRLSEHFNEPGKVML